MSAAWGDKETFICEKRVVWVKTAREGKYFLLKPYA